MSAYTFSVICSLILSLVLLLFQSILFVSLVDKLFCGINRNRLSTLNWFEKSLKFSAIIGYISLSLSALCITLLRLSDLAINGITHYYSTFHLILHSMYMVFMALAFTSAYFFMVCRLISTFERSTLKLSRLSIVIYIGNALITVVLGFILIIMTKSGHFDTSDLHILFAIIVIVPILALINSILSFNRRLLRMVSEQITNERSLSDDQLRLISAARKHTVLGVLLIINAMIALVAYGVATVAYKNSKNTGYYLILSTYLNDSPYFVIFDIIHVICLNFGSLLIYLGFTVNRHCYTGMCHYADGKFRRFCEDFAQKQIKGRGDKVTYQNVEEPDQDGTDAGVLTSDLESNETTALA
eukprot:350226_1